MVANPSYSFKHAFVTGATGMVGVPLCRALSADDVKVTAFSRSAGEYGLPAGVEHVSGDILDLQGLSDAVGDSDVIFHVAAAVHGSAKSHAEFERMNVQGTKNVIQVAERNGIKLVHVSSVNVEGFRTGQLQDSYAATKSRAEELVAAATNDGLDAVIVRPATVVGNESGRAGLLVDRLLTGTLKVLPAPSRKISPVWSVDLATALVRAVRVGRTGQTYTVAGPTLSTGEFVGAVCKSAGLKGPQITIPGWIFAVPLQLAWWCKPVTRWSPPVSVESLRTGSSHDGVDAARELGFEYSTIEEIFGR